MEFSFSITDATQQGQTHRDIMPQTVVAAERIIRETSHFKEEEVAAILDVSHSSSHCIVHDML
jgi:hypothetical protein